MVSKQSSTKSAVNAPKAAPPQQEIDLSLSPAIKFIIFQLVLIATKAGKIPDWGLIALAIGLTKDSADSVRQLYDRESDIILQGERQVGLGMAVWNNENGVYEPSDSAIKGAAKEQVRNEVFLTWYGKAEVQGLIREGDVGLAHEYMGTAVERRKTWCEQNLQRVYKMKGKELARCFEKVITRAKVGMVEG